MIEYAFKPHRRFHIGRVYTETMYIKFDGLALGGIVSVPKLGLWDAHLVDHHEEGPGKKARFVSADAARCALRRWARERNQKGDS